jgi:hypothetical protein
MGRVITALLIFVGIVHLLPLSGVLGAERLATLYGVAIEDPSLEILMRHRAAMFGLLGAFLVYAAFKPVLQTLAVGGGLVSTVSFIAIAWSVGDYNGAIHKVVIADIISATALSIAAAIRVLKAKKPDL